ncbi:GNAT family N-acetyltransferase [Paenibacillus glycanilyticus]|uniref:GNAT family N-acetyltransferase n=1 Tax=Paenibacillus glycanilyticus TaxID=126569 RepID=A0ABQ6NTQ9_9BACL|nr:GNAT family protein [Paenibacillus glycanilyticus]GMK47354.1 GNAT family N-acetyltransferase [Paenibacillus glycanilyticus]
MFKATINNDTYLSLLETRHAKELFQLIDSSRESIREWLEFPDLTHQVEDTDAFIRRSLKRFSENDGYWAGIWYRNKLAGSIGFLYMDWKNKKTEIGYWLGKEYEGLGLATSSCKLFINHAFEELGLHKVQIGVAANNLKSRAIPDRLKFTNEGVIRHYELLHGAYLDRVVYGLLKEEWEPENESQAFI